jgi:hypothetical protein
MDLISRIDEDGTSCKMFRINDYYDANINHAIATLIGKELGERNDIKDLPTVYDRTLLLAFEDEINKLRSSGTKFIFIMDISDFPFISCCIDPTNEKFEDDTDFDRDIRVLWNNYDPKKVIIIVVNSYISHAGLKHIKF